VLLEEEQCLNNDEHGILACKRREGPQNPLIIPDTAHYDIYEKVRSEAHRFARIWCDKHLKGKTENPGDQVTISGRYGEFFVNDTPAEKIDIFELFKGMDTGCRVSYWYGGRSVAELFYLDEFEELENRNNNLKMNIALSDPVQEDNRTGLAGFIHQVLHDKYLADHYAPEDCEYYVCGPVIMLKCCQDMPADFGVEPENIAYDD